MTSSTSSMNSPTQQLLPAARRDASRGGGSLLQERLRERKVESARASRAGADASGERGVQSSPVRGSSREEWRPSSSGVAPPKGMGVKQMEEQVSTLHKQNFDLKLELFHRRQRQESLEARLEAAERQLQEQAEMQEINEQLLAELERRDQALDEAVGVIVTLEDRVEQLLSEREMVKAVDAGPFDVPPYPDNEEAPSSPPEEKPARDRNVIRMPSFLSERSEGTEALRSLYLPQSHRASDITLPQLMEEVPADGLDSPRLSVLSKSSFVSVYGEKPLDLDGEAETPKRHRASSSVEKWIDGPAQPTPSQRLSPDLLRTKQFVSISDVMESPLQRLEKLKHTLEKHNLPERTNGSEKRKPREAPRRAFTDKASFEHQHTLPPTPDTISTSTLRHYKNSNDTLAPEHPAAGSKHAFHAFTSASHNTALSIRPRSAGETITSRREGHGWDTETQDDVTETGSIASISSTFSASAAYRPKRVHTPELFNFSASNVDRDWGRDVLFNEPRLPAHKPIKESRRLSMIEVPRSDPARVPTLQTAMTRYGELTPGATPIDTSPRPQLPDRRSSLSATAKLRKPLPSTQPSPSTVPNPAQASPSAAPCTTKKYRLTSRLFRRGESEPPTPATSQPQEKDKAPPPPPHGSSTQRPRGGNGLGRSHSYFDGHDLDVERATPPPIRRSRTSAGTAYVGRPSSAEGGLSREKRYGGDGTWDESGAGDKNSTPAPLGSTTVVSAAGGAAPPAGAGEEEKGSAAGAGRKWFGGLRRN